MYPWGECTPGVDRKVRLVGRKIEGGSCIDEHLAPTLSVSPPKRKALRGPWEEVLFL